MITLGIPHHFKWCRYINVIQNNQNNLYCFEFQAFLYTTRVVSSTLRCQMEIQLSHTNSSLICQTQKTETGKGGFLCIWCTVREMHSWHANRKSERWSFDGHWTSPFDDNKVWGSILCFCFLIGFQCQLGDFLYYLVSFSPVSTSQMVSGKECL